MIPQLVADILDALIVAFIDGADIDLTDEIKADLEDDYLPKAWEIYKAHYAHHVTSSAKEGE